MDSQFTNFTPLPTQSSNKMRAFIYVGLFILLIALAIFLGNRFLTASQKQTPKPAPTSAPATPTPTVAATPSATLTPKTSPTPTGKLTPTPTGKAATSTSLTIEVLNGSGVKGAAGDAAALLQKAGYTVSSTGNADTFDYTKTTIKIKKSKASLGAQLKKDLSASYTVDPTLQTLAETSSFDAIVIVGSQ